MSESLPRVPRILDFRVSVWAAVGGFSAFLFSTGGIYVKMQTQQATLIEIAAKIDKQGSDYQELFRQIDHQTARTDMLDMRVSSDAKDIADLKTSTQALNSAVQTLSNTVALGTAGGRK